MLSGVLLNTVRTARCLTLLGSQWEVSLATRGLQGGAECLRGGSEAHQLRVCDADGVAPFFVAGGGEADVGGDLSC